MSVGRLLTLGLGSFGGVNFLPTLGYGSGAPTPPVPPAVVQPDGATDGRRKRIYKPTGWLARTKTEREIEREISTIEPAPVELLPPAIVTEPVTPIASMSMAEIDAEIGARIQRMLDDDEDDILALIMSGAI